MLKLLKDADLRRELAGFGLLADGRRPELERRYRAYIDTHNAQVGALRPASHAEVLRRVRHHLGVRHSTDLKRRRHRDVDRLRCEVKWPWRGTRPS